METITVEASSAFLRPPDRPSGKPADAGLTFPKGHVPGTTPEMREIYAQIQAVARWDVSILLVGETGAGKEPLAEAIHLSSPRAGMPLVAINCAAIPAELLEAEMFGIGARVATGVGPRRGRFQEAHGGTLFLDEIGEMPLELQSKLLRVLQERLVRPLGEPPVAGRRADRGRHQRRGCRPSSTAAGSGATSTSGWPASWCGCLPCAAAPRTSRCWSRGW